MKLLNKSMQNTSNFKKIGINVECPKVYGNSMTLSSCSKCEFYKGLNESKIYCNYTNNGGLDVKSVHPNNKMNDLRLLLSPYKNEILERVLSDQYMVEFVFKVPESISNKKKMERLNSNHIQKPDIDNLFKAFTDTLFY